MIYAKYWNLNAVRPMLFTRLISSYCLEFKNLSICFVRFSEHSSDILKKYVLFASGFPLVRAAQGLVIVDKETHSPAEHPDSFVKKFGNVRPKIIIERFM